MTEKLPEAPPGATLHSVLAPFVDSLGTHRQAFEAAADNCANSTASAEKFNKAASVAKAEADEISEKIRNAYREGGGANTKSVVKLKSEQRAALENREILTSLEAEAKIEAGRAEIEMHRAATSYKSVYGNALNAACVSMMDDFFGSLPAQILSILALNETIAERGLSVLYQENREIKSPKDYALREFSIRLRVAYQSSSADTGLQQILPPNPAGMGRYGASPLTIQKLENNLGAQEAALRGDDWREGARRNLEHADLAKQLPSTL